MSASPSLPVLVQHPAPPPPPGGRAQLVQAVEANRRAAALAHDRYRNGLGTFVNVLDSPRALLASQSDLAQSEATASTDVVALYEALGGGWERPASAPCRRRAARSSPVGRTGSADLMA